MIDHSHWQRKTIIQKSGEKLTRHRRRIVSLVNPPALRMFMTCEIGESPTFVVYHFEIHVNSSGAMQESESPLLDMCLQALSADVGHCSQGVSATFLAHHYMTTDDLQVVSLLSKTSEVLLPSHDGSGDVLRSGRVRKWDHMRARWRKGAHQTHGMSFYKRPLSVGRWQAHIIQHWSLEPDKRRVLCRFPPIILL
ncbi:hypothetical protein KC359_g64 [Hortaea werneckii]|nr:hypothetical protein KC359_g64 [Hortaea werneckii]